MAEYSGYATEKKNKIVKRTENFDHATLAFLCDEVEKYIDIINSKHTNTITNKKKTEAWEKIADAVNARGGVRRTVPQLKEKYRKAVSKAKIDANVSKREAFKTGGGNAPKPLNNTLQKIYDLNAQTPSFTGISNGIDLGISVVGDTINVDNTNTICMLDDTQYEIDADWSDICGGDDDHDVCYIGDLNKRSETVSVVPSTSTVSGKDGHTASTVCLSYSQVHNEERNRSEKVSIVPTTSTVFGRDGHTASTVCLSNSQVHNKELNRSEKGTEHQSASTESRRDMSRNENGTKHHSMSTLSGRGKQSKNSNVVRPCSRTSKIQETVNLRQLQMETLSTEKRKSEIEIEKLHEETLKLKSEVCKLEEERDLYKIQKEYYKLKLKRLKEEMNEQ